MQAALTLGSARTSQVKNEIAPDRYDLARSGDSSGRRGRRPHIKLNGREFREYRPPGQNARDGDQRPRWPKMVPNRAWRVLSRAVHNGHGSAAARRTHWVNHPWRPDTRTFLELPNAFFLVVSLLCSTAHAAGKSRFNLLGLGLFDDSSSSHWRRLSPSRSPARCLACRSVASGTF